MSAPSYLKLFIITTKEENNSNQNELIEQFAMLLEHYEELKYNCNLYLENNKYLQKELSELKKTATVPAPVYNFNVN